jgi:hypothetical protein
LVEPAFDKLLDASSSQGDRTWAQDTLADWTVVGEVKELSDARRAELEPFRESGGALAQALFVLGQGVEQLGT